MSHREFTATRTMLANAMATAGAELLEYMNVGAALAAIPNTEPPKYVVAGTLQMISKMLPGLESAVVSSAPAAAGIEGLTRYAPHRKNLGAMARDEEGAYLKFADIERLLGAHAGVVAAGPDEPLTIALGQGQIEIGQGHHGNDRAPALLFGRNGAGKVGVETQGDRVMEPGECIAAVTFENYQSLDVVVEKLGELRARIWPNAPHSQLSYGAAPHFRGYAHLGIGAYVINHSAAGEPPELAISIATEAQKAGRIVGDTRDNEPGALVQPKDIAVRLRFENVAGLDALEQQLRFVRSEHFADAAPAAQAPVQNAEEVRAFLEEMAQCGKDMNGSYWIPRAVKLLAGLASKEAAAAEAPSQWISVDERLPEKECLAVYVTPNGKQRLIRAKYVRQFQIEAEGDDQCETEYNDDDDTFYIKAGWLECIDNWGEYSSCYVTEGTVTHWMPLPAAPQQSTQGEKGGDGE